VPSYTRRLSKVDALIFLLFKIILMPGRGTRRPRRGTGMKVGRVRLIGN